MPGVFLVLGLGCGAADVMAAHAIHTLLIERALIVRWRAVVFWCLTLLPLLIGGNGIRRAPSAR